MKILKSFLASTLAIISVVGSTAAQPGFTDPSHGREVADIFCSSCHEVEPGSKETLKSDVPTFLSIANREDQTADHLAVAIILSQHPEMPKVALTTKQLRDVVAYIMSLRTRE